MYKFAQVWDVHPVYTYIQVHSVVHLSCMCIRTLFARECVFAYTYVRSLKCMCGYEKMFPIDDGV